MKKIIDFCNDIPAVIWFVIIFFITFIYTIGQAIHSSYTTSLKQKYLYNYILYTDVKVIERPKECENVNYCDYITSKGKMNLNDNIFHVVTKDQKFDIGIKIGTCSSNVYAKIYTNDTLEPFYTVDIKDIRYHDDSYLIYKESFKLPNQPKCK